jgi:hypothetical protein
MCDYSLHRVDTRPAKKGDILVTSSFQGATTRGFVAAEEPGVAVCLLPGTEIAFEADVRYYFSWPRFFRRPRTKSVRQRRATFRQVGTGEQKVHHDAVEFPSGDVLLLNSLLEGQTATVLQLPAPLKGLAVLTKENPRIDARAAVA